MSLTARIPASSCDSNSNLESRRAAKPHLLRSPLVAVLLTSGLLLAALPDPARSQQSCCASGPLSQPCNVYWWVTDSLIACPAGDSVSSLRPSRLYLKVHYEDNNCQTRAGVPPESIWVTYATTAGNLVLNDKGAKVFADDSTNSGGNTWITLRSFSGCGKMRFNLSVSGTASGSKTLVIRTTDRDGDGRVESTEGSPGCDLNYDGIVNSQDSLIAAPHVTDWKRNTLHGTLVKRTNLCDTCAAGQANTMGSGDLSWSPSGRRIVFSIRDEQRNCKIFHAAADPSGGNVPQEFTWPATPDPDDYDPSWSPLGDQIFWVRNDQAIYRKGIPGIATDSSEIVVYDTQIVDGGCCEAVSPDGRTIAFSRSLDGIYWTIWTVPVAGGTPRQITTASNFWDWYPKWSPDGQTLVFDRKTVSGPDHGHRAAYTVSAFEDSTPPPTPLYDVSGTHAALASYSEDGAVVTAGVGPLINATTAHTLDATGTSGFRPIQNYDQYTSNNLFPRPSPDGTRLAVQAKSPLVPGALTPQLWAVRRNMNLPPQFTAAGGQSVADSTPRVYFTMLQGHNYTIALMASDPEPDPPRTYHAYYLQQGMTFADSTFSWVPPPGTAGQVFNVKFGVTTASGGADAIIAVITVNANLGPAGSAAPMAQETVSAVSDGRGLVRFAFRGVRPKTAELAVFDIAGRKLTQLEGHPPDALRWDGRDANGKQVGSGVYFYRIRTGAATHWGKLVYLR